MLQIRFEDTTGVIRSRKSKKEWQYNGQNTMIYKTLYWATWIVLKSRRCSGMISSSCSTGGTRHVLFIQIWWKVTNEKRTGWWLPQTEHRRGNLWCRYSLTVDQVMVAIYQAKDRGSFPWLTENYKTQRQRPNEI